MSGDNSSHSTANAVLASVKELRSVSYRGFMFLVNIFAAYNNLQVFPDNWSKGWEYPWLWFNALSGIDWCEQELLDVGSADSPMPWLFANFGAKVTLVELYPHWIPLWEQIRETNRVNVDWVIVPAEDLPFDDSSFDIVTSFSVIEHQVDKQRAVEEVARILRPGGLFALSFDLFEAAWGMTYPNHLGEPLTSTQFEEFVWNCPAFDNGGKLLDWNVEMCSEFMQWHAVGASDSKYTVGAAFVQRKQLSPEELV